MRFLSPIRQPGFKVIIDLEQSEICSSSKILQKLYVLSPSSQFNNRPFSKKFFLRLRIKLSQSPDNLGAASLINKRWLEFQTKWSKIE